MEPFCIKKILTIPRLLPLQICHLCKACRSAAVKFCPETVRGNRHGICRDISGEILLLLFPQETKLESAWDFSRQISRPSSPDALQLQMPDFMALFILQTFVLEIWCSERRTERRVAQFDRIRTLFRPILTYFDLIRQVDLTYFHLFRPILPGGP